MLFRSRELVAAMQALRRTHAQAEPLEFRSQRAVEVARWMAACNLLALPSYSEGHPNVLVEALACGRPVVSCPVGGVPEVVDASCAMLAPPRDAGALCEALAGVLERDWDEVALSRRFSRPWGEVAAETLAACIEAQDAHRNRSRE